MKKKKFNSLIIGLIVGIVTVIAFASLSPLFHQEVPKNTIRILMDRVFTFMNPRFLSDLQLQSSS